MTTTYRVLQPAADLAPFVQHYWVLAADASDAEAHPIFPDGGPELVFHYGDRVREATPDGHGWVTQPRAMLVGQMTRAVWIAAAGQVHAAGVKLAPWGAAAFFGGRALEWRDRTVALDALRGDADAINGIADAMAAGASDRIVQHLDAMLRTWLGAQAIRSNMDMAALATALHASPGLSVDALSQSLGWSVRTLERRFDQWIGVTPKELLRIRRFQRALRAVIGAPDVTLSVIAAKSGYSDHSHLVREFRAFAGTPPVAAISAMTALSKHFVEGVRARPLHP